MRTTRMGMMPFMIALISKTWIERVSNTLRLHLGFHSQTDTPAKKRAASTALIPDTCGLSV
jgi:hypothetical protein